ncbi:hypothetical protein PJL18_04038 [Paenarthrobacter nicotinovorans]|nr:hypothetical protein [Paenarthrobacter nicotinovorans]
MRAVLPAPSDAPVESTTSSSPDTPSTPSTSVRQRSTTSDASAVCLRLATETKRRVPPSFVSVEKPKRIGATICLYSKRPGLGVESDSTMPSITKLPSCTTSPKSPP